MDLNQLFRVVILGVNLFQDDLPLPFQVPRRQLGLKDQVAQQVQQPGQALRQDSPVEAGLLLAGEGVALPAQLVDFPGYVQDVAPGGALKGHVLQEMGQTVLGAGLIPGAHVEPNPHRRRVEVGQFPR